MDYLDIKEVRDPSVDTENGIECTDMSDAGDIETGNGYSKAEL